jgi:hypothetical protein
MTDLTSSPMRARLAAARRDAALTAAARFSSPVGRAQRLAKILRSNSSTDIAYRVTVAQLRDGSAVADFGHDTLRTAAMAFDMQDGDVCKWCFAGARARVHEAPLPHRLIADKPRGERKSWQGAFVVLLGSPCKECARAVTDLSFRADGARRRDNHGTSGNVVTAGTAAEQVRQIARAVVTSGRAAAVASGNRRGPGSAPTGFLVLGNDVTAVTRDPRWRQWRGEPT